MLIFSRRISLVTTSSNSSREVHHLDPNNLPLKLSNSTTHCSDAIIYNLILILEEILDTSFKQFYGIFNRLMISSMDAFKP